MQSAGGNFSTDSVQFRYLVHAHLKEDEVQIQVQSLLYSQLRVLTYIQLHGVPPDPPKPHREKTMGFREYIMESLKGIQESFVQLVTGKRQLEDPTAGKKTRREIEAENLNSLKQLTSNKDGSIKSYKNLDELVSSLSKFISRK